MKLNGKSGANIAMTAAALLVSGTALVATAYAVEGIRGRCFGVNSCAGTGACNTPKNACKGMNACKGQGWLEMLQDECEKAGGRFEKG
jgi:hypothetical protein